MRNILFKSCNCGYEEGYTIVIWEQNGNLFMRERGHCVMTGSYDIKRKISQEEALEIIMENKDYER